MALEVRKTKQQSGHTHGHTRKETNHSKQSHSAKQHFVGPQVCCAALFMSRWCEFVHDRRAPHGRQTRAPQTHSGQHRISALRAADTDSPHQQHEKLKTGTELAVGPDPVEARGANSSARQWLPGCAAMRMVQLVSRCKPVDLCHSRIAMEPVPGVQHALAWSPIC